MNTIRTIRKIFKWTPKAFFDAIKEGDIEHVRELLENGANPNKRDSDGYLPLTLVTSAEFNVSVEIAALLLEYGADPNRPDSLPPLFNASSVGDLELVRLLVDRGADVNKPWETLGRTPLWVAAQDGHTQIVEYLLDRGASPNQRDTSGWTPLHAAAISGKLEIVKLLLERGTYTDADRESCLREAAAYGRSKVVKLLIVQGTDPNKGDEEGYTALHNAARRNDFETVKMLLLHGADPSIKSKRGTLPIHLAIKFPRVRELLKIPLPPPPLVLGKEKTRNAYKDLGVEPTASLEEIRKKYLELRKNIEQRKTKGSATEMQDTSSSRSLRSITASYNILKNNREEYDNVVDKPRRVLLAKLRKLCFEDMDVVSMRHFDDMTLEELRRVYVLSKSEGKLVDDAIQKGHCFEEDTLKTMYKNGMRTNPLTREPLSASLLAELAKGGGVRVARKKKTTK